MEKTIMNRLAVISLVSLFVLVSGSSWLFSKSEAGNSPPKSPRNVAIMIWPGVELLDFAGPGEVFAAARVEGKSAFRVFTVSPKKEKILSQGFLTVEPQYSIKDCPEIDILVIPGGGTQSLRRTEGVVDWVERIAAEEAEVVLSVCTGAFVLADAGLLEGLEATTWHGAIPRLRETAPDTVVRENVRFVDNGKIVTSAGVSAGIDSSLHLVSRLHGRNVAAQTARYMEYRWEPGPEQKDHKDVVETDEGSKPLAIGGLDPVALVEGEESRGSTEIEAQDRDYRYHFATEANRKKFKANPDKYGIQARGSCAGMGAQIEVGSGDPDLFTVHDGRIYIFAGPRCKADFLGEPDRFVKEIVAAIKDQWQ